MNKFQIIGLLFLMFSCDQNIENVKEKEIIAAEIPNVAKDGITQEEYFKSQQENRNQFELHNSLSLRAGIDTVKKYMHLKNFNSEFYHISSDSSYDFNVKISIENTFSNSKKHAKITRGVGVYYHVYFYLIDNNELIPVLKHEQDDNTFIRDTIFDVNGDRLKDFVVHWYPSSGCCRRDVFTVYLNKDNSGEFISEIDFMNPTFYPKQKKVLGMTYDHSISTALYKLKWNGNKIDTIEYINIDTSSNREAPFFKTKENYWGQRNIKKIPLKELPAEYNEVDNYWFGGDFKPNSLQSP